MRLESESTMASHSDTYRKLFFCYVVIVSLSSLLSLHILVQIISSDRQQLPQNQNFSWLVSACCVLAYHHLHQSSDMTWSATHVTLTLVSVVHVSVVSAWCVDSVTLVTCSGSTVMVTHPPPTLKTRVPFMIPIQITT